MGRKIKKQKPKDKQENFSIELVKDIDENLDNIKKMLEEPSDLVIRKFTIGENKKCGIVYIDGLTDSILIHNNIMKNLQVDINDNELSDDDEQLFEQIYSRILSVTGIEKGETMDELSLELLSGATIFYLDGVDQVLIMDTKLWLSRALEEPESETVVRGPREGFVENIQTNMSLIRRSIRDPNLRFKTHRVGRRGKRNLVVVYMADIINPDLLKEVNRRLEAIDIEDAPDTGFIEQWIQDSIMSPFPQVMSTERPDKTVSAILQGKVAIQLDGTPITLILPTTLASEMHSPEDYYERWTIGTLLRVLRYLAAFIAMFLPGLYIALVSHHQGMIPSDLAFSLAASREGVPFPPFIEAMLMAMTMELLREAGIRLPSAIGQTIGIVGGLVIGEAAVSAGLVSPIMVIVIALHAIASFSLPSYSFAIAIRIIMFGFMFAATVLGLFGIIMVYIMINIHLVNLKSFGVPYTTPFAPTFFKDWNDLVFRAPPTMLENRPEHLKPEDEQRAKETK